MSNELGPKIGNVVNIEAYIRLKDFPLYLDEKREEPVNPGKKKIKKKPAKPTKFKKSGK